MKGTQLDFVWVVGVSEGCRAYSTINHGLRHMFSCGHFVKNLGAVK